MAREAEEDQVISGWHLTPGYRFYPTEEELVGFYLCHKLSNTRDDIGSVIPVVDVYHYEPWQLPQLAGEPCIRDPEQWFFFCPMQAREFQGGRPTRTTATGYWKATGSPSAVYPASRSGSGRAIGVKKTMVFYEGRAPQGTKTKWKMNEYKAVDEGAATVTAGGSSSSTGHKTRNDYSLCRVYVKSGCVRSFDRRPTGTGGGGDEDQVITPAPQHQRPPPLPSVGEGPSVAQTASLDTSSSGVGGGGAGDVDLTQCWSLDQVWMD